MPFTKQQMMEIKSEIKSAVKEIVCEMFKEESFLTPLFTGLLEKVQGHLTDIVNIEVNKVSEEVRVLKEENITLKDKLDEQEQYSRRTSIRIFGLKEDRDGKLLDTVMSLLQDRMGTDITSECIDRCHKIGNPINGTVPVIVKFTASEYCQRILHKKKSLKNTGIAVVEDMTRERYRIFSRAKEWLGKKNVWFLNGAIHAKVTDKDGSTSHFKFKTMRDLLRVEGAVISI